jgi:hypothetical protein
VRNSNSRYGIWICVLSPDILVGGSGAFEVERSSVWEVRYRGTLLD